MLVALLYAWAFEPAIEPRHGDDHEEHAEISPTPGDGGIDAVPALVGGGSSSEAAPVDAESSGATSGEPS